MQGTFPYFLPMPKYLMFTPLVAHTTIICLPVYNCSFCVKLSFFFFGHIVLNTGLSCALY